MNKYIYTCVCVCVCKCIHSLISLPIYIDKTTAHMYSHIHGWLHTYGLSHTQPPIYIYIYIYI